MQLNYEMVSNAHVRQLTVSLLHRLTIRTNPTRLVQLLDAGAKSRFLHLES